jgi:hypothetical protein
VVLQISPFKRTHVSVDGVLRLIAEGADVQPVIVGAAPS